MYTIDRLSKLISGNRVSEVIYPRVSGSSHFIIIQIMAKVVSCSLSTHYIFFTKESININLFIINNIIFVIKCLVFLTCFIR